jgi:hypothetical protein
MNVGRLTGGIICLALAGLLGVLNIILPPDRLMFTVGDANMPFVPPIILGIVGLVLVITAVSGRRAGSQETAQESEPESAPAIDEEKAALNKRLEAIGWGLFLVMLGGFILVPDELVAEGLWSIGVGAIMLGLNGARYYFGIKMSGFTTLLGILALLGGIAQLLWVQDIGGALLLIILGAYLLLKPWFEKQQLFGKAEES